jgi:catechol 2,3-dioxygenase-like lactoylglutathione lyase family enzyme
MTKRESSRDAEWNRLRDAHLRTESERATTIGRGVHHAALISLDVERTIAFYQDTLGFPLTELFENRDYADSTHFFFDVGNGNYLAFFDFPGLDLGGYAEVLGGLHHVAISVDRPHWEAAVTALRNIGTELHFEADSSVYFAGPDGERIELISDPLGEMYGTKL